MSAEKMLEEAVALSRPTGDGSFQYCPRCGASNAYRFPVAKCKACSWKVVWVGPLWGVA